MLAAELANEASPAHIRNAAGLAVKNALAARDPTRQEEYAQRWVSLAAEARQEVKLKTVSTLGSQDARAGHVSAQVIAAIAAIELPRNMWPELIGQLTAAMADTGNTRLRQAVLQTIGFTCESSVSWACARRERAQADPPLLLSCRPRPKPFPANLTRF